MSPIESLATAVTEAASPNCSESRPERWRGMGSPLQARSPANAATIGREMEGCKGWVGSISVQHAHDVLERDVLAEVIPI